MKFHDQEELELMKSIETEGWVSVNNLEEVQGRSCTTCIVIQETFASKLCTLCTNVPISYI